MGRAACDLSIASFRFVVVAARWAKLLPLICLLVQEHTPWHRAAAVNRGYSLSQGDVKFYWLLKVFYFYLGNQVHLLFFGCRSSRHAHKTTQKLGLLYGLTLALSQQILTSSFTREARGKDYVICSVGREEGIVRDFNLKKLLLSIRRRC